MGHRGQRFAIVVDDDWEYDADGIKDILCVSLRFDHDLMDGAPITRFGASFVQHLENHQHLLMP